MHNTKLSDRSSERMREKLAKSIGPGLTVSKKQLAELRALATTLAGSRLLWRKDPGGEDHKLASQLRLLVQLGERFVDKPTNEYSVALRQALKNDGELDANEVDGLIVVAERLHEKLLGQGDFEGAQKIAFQALEDLRSPAISNALHSQEKARDALWTNLGRKRGAAVAVRTRRDYGDALGALAGLFKTQAWPFDANKRDIEVLKSVAYVSVEPPGTKGGHATLVLHYVGEPSRQREDTLRSLIGTWLTDRLPDFALAIRGTNVPLQDGVGGARAGRKLLEKGLDKILGDFPLVNRERLSVVMYPRAPAAVHIFYRHTAGEPFLSHLEQPLSDRLRQIGVSASVLLKSVDTGAVFEKVR